MRKLLLGTTLALVAALLLLTFPVRARSIQAVSGGLWVPEIPTASVAGVISFTNNTMDASAEKVACIVRAPKSGTLNKFGWRQSTNTNQPDNGLRFSFQDVSGADADGVVDQFADVTSGFGTGVWLAPTGNITSDGTGGGVKRTVTAGDYLALVVEYVSFVAADSITMSGVNQPTDLNETMVVTPYARLFTAAWANFASNGFCPVGLEYSDGTYVYLGATAVPYLSQTTTTFNSGSTPDERALRFQLPFGAQVSGAWMKGDIDNAADLVLYDSDGSTPLVTVALPTTQRPDTSIIGMTIPFASQTLTANTTYRLSVKPGASNITAEQFGVSTNAHLGGITGGIQFYLSTRVNAGAWDDSVTTSRPQLGLLITGVDTGSTGGGSFPFVGLTRLFPRPGR